MSHCADRLGLEIDRLKRLAVALLLSFRVATCLAQPTPGLTLTISGDPTAAVSNPLQCDVHESPDAPARAIHLSNGSVQLYATDQVNQLTTGSNLLHLVQNCGVVYQGGHDDDPAAFDDRSWLATPWTSDGNTIWVIVHDEFHGDLRKDLCPSGRYMDCWYNTLTLAVSTDSGQHFHRADPQKTVASVPYRYEDVGKGHHGFFNPTNIVSRDGQLYMLAFATKTGVQAEGNCLLRTKTIADASSWLAWDGRNFAVHLINPYQETGDPAQHVCQPVAPGSLRWPVASLVRHVETGLYIALMENATRNGGIYYSTSADLVQWSMPSQLMPVIGVGGWVCGDPQPLAYPSLLDPASSDRNFETVGDRPSLFLTQFDVKGCNRGQRRNLMRWQVKISPLELHNKTLP